MQLFCTEIKKILIENVEDNGGEENQAVLRQRRVVHSYFITVFITSRSHVYDLSYLLLTTI